MFARDILSRHWFCNPANPARRAIENRIIPVPYFPGGIWSSFLLVDFNALRSAGAYENSPPPMP
jgi:hypothetical protein